MTRLFVISDTHFGHGNIIKFVDDKGEIIRKHPSGRPFETVHEHDELVIQRWNETVTPEDYVYHLGDVAINKQIIKHGLLSRLMGHKRLVRGNHDICDTRDYMKDFGEIFGVRVFQPGTFKNQQLEGKGFILSHIPIHPASIKEGWVNVHGHTHSNIVRLENGHPDVRYKCVSLDHTDYRPVLLFETK